MDTSTISNIQQHPAAVDLYLRHGWKLIPMPYGKKGPTHANWNQPGNWLDSPQHLPEAFNIGLGHAYSGTMALDVDDWEKAAQTLSAAGIDLQTLYDAPDAVTIESGNPGHGKLLYAMPFGLVLPSKKLIYENSEGVKLNYLDFRCGTSAGTTVQDVIPPSMHPDTGQAYRWGGKGQWSRLPTIPFELLTFWQEQLVTPEPTVSASNFLSTDLSEVRSALVYLPPDCDRTEWLTVGMGLHHLGMRTNQLPEAFAVWHEWSAGGGEKYKGQRDLEIVWNSFKATQTSITIASTFDLARRNGWIRPTPSAEHLFKSTEKPLDVFQGMRPPSPDLDLSLIPGVLAKRSEEIASTRGCDPLVPLFAGLGAVCGAVDARTRLELTHGYIVPPILWLMTIGAPSDRKSPGSKPMMEILREIEREDLPNFQKKHLAWSVQNRIHAKAHEAYLDHMSEPERAFDPENTAVETPPVCPREPKQLLISVQDITSQKLLHHGADNPRGLLCYLDEMNGWVGQLTNKLSHENRSTWIAGFEGGRARMDRIGSGEIIADPFSVSIFGNMQPQVWRDSIKPLSADGVIARFIPAVLRPDKSALSQPVPDELTSVKEYEGMIRQIYAMPAQTYTLSDEAYKLFREHQAWTIERQRDDRVMMMDINYQFSFGKGDGTVGRLALVFHLMTHPFLPEVQADTMDRAIKFFRSYIVPALRYAYAEVGGQLDGSLDVWMASHILAICDREEVTLRELKHSARRRIEDLAPHQRDHTVLDAMLPLEAAGWVQLVDENRKNNSFTWAINPALKETYKDYRRQVLTIKQRMLDQIDASIEKARGKERPRRLVPGYNVEWDN